MENKKDFKDELYWALSRNYITQFEHDEGLKKYEKDGNTDILKLIDERKRDREKAKTIMNKKWYKLSELEALQTIVDQNKAMIKTQNGIKGWVTFMGIVLIIYIILSILSALSILSLF